jgi:hypothetical protein
MIDIVRTAKNDVTRPDFNLLRSGRRFAFDEGLVLEFWKRADWRRVRCDGVTGC